MGRRSNKILTSGKVYDAIVAELARQQIYVHLDNHMSKGKWCCSGNDGNTWFGDTDFNVNNWKRGLQFMADYVKFSLTTKLNASLIIVAEQKMAQYGRHRPSQRIPEA